jgi:alginate O-acetyltransferase complex protein AlgI
MTGQSMYYLVFIALLLSGAQARGVRTRQILFLTASYLFYATWGIGFLFVLIASSLLNYSWGAILRRRLTLPWLWAGVLLNVLLLAFCKYIAALLDGGALQSDLLSQVIRPVGISFWTLQGLSFLFDIYREEELDPSLTEFCLFMAFWPTVLAGPICRLPSMLPQFRHGSPASSNDISLGMTRVVQGLFMKLVLAQLLAYGLSPAGGEAGGFDESRPGGGLDVWFVAVASGFYIFLDFAGYSHLAIGSARLFGIRLPENFDRPFISLTPSVFWTRWHMSFSFWIRDYVFVPLATMRREMWWLYGAIIASMALVGAWHEVKATFVAWGVYHGLLLAAHRMGQRLTRVSPFSLPQYAGRALSWAGTFAFVSLGWILFRAPDLPHAVAMLTALITPHDYFVLALPRRFYMITAAIVFGYFGYAGLETAIARWRSRFAASPTPAEGGGEASPVSLAGLSVDLLEFSAARRWWWLAPALVVVGVFVGLALLQQGAAVRTTPFVYTLF